MSIFEIVYAILAASGLTCVFIYICLDTLNQFIELRNMPDDEDEDW